jgi:peroxiredoxin
LQLHARQDAAAMIINPFTIKSLSTQHAMERMLRFMLCGLMAFAMSGCGHQTAPNVSFSDIKGNKISLQDLRGKVVIVNFWATWCTTCVGEMPDMVKTYEKYHAQGLEYVAIAMSSDAPNYVVNFAETRKLPFQVALDVDGKLADSFGDVKMTPTTFVIDKQGRIVKKYVGAPEFYEFHRLLEAQIAA